MRWQAKVSRRSVLRSDERVVIDHQEVREKDYSGKKLKMFCSIGSQFERCQFQRTYIVDAQFGAGTDTSIFNECSFDGSKFLRISGGPSRFVRCSFRDVEIESWIAREVELIECVFSGQVKSAVFNGAVRSDFREIIGRDRNEIRGNDFSAAQFIDVGFRTGVDLSIQKLPSGDDYLYLPNAEEAIRGARLPLLNWTNFEWRRRLLQELEGMQREVNGGQSQLLLRKSDYSLYVPIDSEAVDILFGLLQGKIASLN